MESAMIARLTFDLYNPYSHDFLRERAKNILDNLDESVDRMLRFWLRKLLADKRNATKEFRIIRAHRRGLLHYDRPHRWGYPSNWKEIASKIRDNDGRACTICLATNTELHVHHLIYVSNFGTHQKTNLVTLCKTCHEEEHGRELDFGEFNNPNDELPIEENSIDTLWLEKSAPYRAKKCRCGELVIFRGEKEKCHKCHSDVFLT